MLYITRFITVNFLHYFSKATRGPSLGTTSWEQAGMCGFGEMVESVDGESGKVRLWTGRESEIGKSGFEDMAGN